MPSALRVVFDVGEIVGNGVHPLPLGDQGTRAHVDWIEHRSSALSSGGQTCSRMAACSMLIWVVSSVIAKLCIERFLVISIISLFDAAIAVVSGNSCWAIRPRGLAAVQAEVPAGPADAWAVRAVPA